MATKSKKNKTIVLTIPAKRYAGFVKSPSKVHEIIKENLIKTPELFPSAIVEKGYILDLFWCANQLVRVRFHNPAQIPIRSLSERNLYRFRPAMEFSTVTLILLLALLATFCHSASSFFGFFLYGMLNFLKPFSSAIPK